MKIFQAIKSMFKKEPTIVDILSEKYHVPETMKAKRIQVVKTNTPTVLQGKPMHMLLGEFNQELLRPYYDNHAHFITDRSDIRYTRAYHDAFVRGEIINFKAQYSTETKELLIESKYAIDIIVEIY